jgi:hypothetical protein
MAGGGGWGLSSIYINPKKKLKKKTKKIKKKKSFIYLDMSVFLLTFATTEDNTESSPLPAAIGSNESLVLDRVGRI